jgi:hypothetical protein
MKKIFLRALLLAAAALAASASGAPARQRKAHTFRCTDRNTSLHFVVYENGSTLEVGRMYVEDMQVGLLKPEHAGTGVIKAAVVGNAAANVAFQLHKSPGRVMVANYGPDPSRVEVCKASYKSRIVLARHHSIDGIYQW